MANALAIALGYPLPNWFGWKAARDDNDNIVEFNGNPYLVKPNEYLLANTRRRIASELLHGRFEPYHGMDDNDNNPFVYQFGQHDYTSEQTKLVLNNDGQPIMSGDGPKMYTAKFELLGNLNDIYTSLPSYMRIRGLKDFNNIGKPTIVQVRGRRLARETELARFATALEKEYGDNAIFVARKMLTRYRPVGAVFGLLDDPVMASLIGQYLERKNRALGFSSVHEFL